MPRPQDVESSVDGMSLEWEGIGELVRECTLLVLLECLCAAAREGHGAVTMPADPTWN